MTPIWEELRHSCLSIQRHYQGKWKIFIVGDKPPFRGPYTYIKHDACTHREHAKAFDSILKLRLIAEHPEIDNEFIYMYDDQIFLRKVTLAELSDPVAHGEVGVPEEYFAQAGRIPSGRWKKLFIRSMYILIAEGLPTWNYETHSPRLFRKDWILETIEKFALDNQPILFNSIYMNHHYDKPAFTLKSKPNYMLGLHNPRPLWWIERETKGKMILNYCDIGLNKDLQQFIKDVLRKK